MKVIRISFITFFILSHWMAYAQSHSIYSIVAGDSILTNQFIQRLCHAARNPETGITGKPSELERLINLASGTEYKAPDQPQMTLRWHRKYGSQINCPATDKYPEGDILRQVVHSNFRDFANLVGPNNRLSLDLTIPDKNDSLAIFEYINQKRMEIEKHYHNKRFEFQQDEKWRNIMFFYFLFSEYMIHTPPK